MNRLRFLIPAALLSLLTAVQPLAAETVKASAEPTVMTLKNGTQLTVKADYKVDVNASEPSRMPVRKMALFVSNGTGQTAFDRTADTLATQVAAGIAGQRIEVLDPRDAAQSRDGRPMLTEASRTRLAEAFGLDYVLVLTLDRFDRSVMRLKDSRFGPSAGGDGTTLKRERIRLTATYRVLDAMAGTAIGGGTVSAARNLRSTAGLETERGSFGDGLEEQMAQTLAKRILADEPTWREASLKQIGLPVTVDVQAYDLNNQPIYLPMFDADKPVVNRRVPAQISALVEVDGAVRATSGGVMRLTPGPHTLRITRTGYEPLEMTVVPSADMRLTVSLKMTEDEYARVKDSVLFMHGLSKDRDLSAAEAERLRGHARMLEQSGLRVEADRLPDTEIRPLL